MSQTSFLGDPGERLAAAGLWQAMLGELHPGTLNDNYNKVDHRVVYTCPFSEQRREIRCQVKAGDSYGEWTKTKDRFRINANEKLRKQLRLNDDPTLLVWIPETNRRILYAIIPPRRTEREPIYVNPTCQMSPAMLFDVARTHATFSRLEPTRQIIFTQSDSVSVALKKKLHKNQLSFEAARVVRNLRLSNSALRHVTRDSRPSIRRRLSLDILKYLPRVFETAPQSVQCLKRSGRTLGGRKQVESLLLFRFPRVFKSTEGEVHTLMVRIREAVSFPVDWMTAFLCLDGPHEGSVQSQASVESWYLKREKNG